MASPKPYILQDRTKGLILTATLSNGGSPVPNFTLTIMSGFDSTVLATVDVVNPNGVETVVTVAALVDQNIVDTGNNGVWWNEFLTFSGMPGGVNVDSNEVLSTFDAWGGIAGTYGVYRDVDGTSIWCATWVYSGLSLFQKYDLATRAFLDYWCFPFQGGSAYATAVSDGTTTFFQDSVGNLYALTNESNDSFSSFAPQRIHKVDKTTKLEIAALGYDQQHPDPGGTFANLIYGPYAWCVFSNSGNDFVAFASANGFIHIINLTAMTLVGSFDVFSTFGYNPKSVTKDEDGETIWFGCDSNSDSNAYTLVWNGGTSGTVGADPQLGISLVSTTPGANFQSGTPANNNAYFWRYKGGSDEGEHMIISDFSTGEEGYGGDLALIDIATGNQLAFVSSAEPSTITTGDIDSAYAGFRDNQTLAYDPGVITVIGDTALSFTPAQLGGVLNFLDPDTLAITSSFNITNISATELNVSQPPQYTYRGVWDSGTNYDVGDIVTGSDGTLYLAITTSGPSDTQGLGVFDPSARTFTPNARVTNWFNWAGLPAFQQGINTGSRNPAYPTIGGYAYDPTSNSIVTGYDFVGSTAIIVYLSPGGGGLTLDDCIADICLRCGLTLNQIDVSQCTDIPVDGYLLTSQVDGKSALQNLLAAYFVDCVESDLKLKFVPRGKNASVLQIPEDDLGLVADKAKLTETMPQQQELPRSVSILYIDKALDYQQGKQDKQRNSQCVTTRQVVTVTIPMVFSADKAAAIAEENLYTAWLNSKPYDLNLFSMKYAILDPTDLFQFVYQSKAYQARVTTTSLGVNFATALSCVSEDSNSYTSITTGAKGDGITVNPGQPAVAQVLFLGDFPYLQDSDASADRSQTGYYFGTSGIKPNPGGVLFKSSDDAVFDSIDSSAARMIYGTCTNTLGDPPSLWTWDDTNTLNIMLADSTWTLEGTTDINVLNGANGLIVGGEVIQYVNAVEELDGSFTISRLLRGRRNTEYASTGHVASEIAFDPTTGMKHEASPLALVGLPRYYRDVTVGQNITDVTSTNFTINAFDLKPASPVHIKGTRDMSSNLTIGWIRRTRYAGDWINGSGNVPLNEDSEQYSLDVLNGLTVVRTIDWVPGTYDSDGLPQASYSAADQTTDFGSPQSAVSVAIYQISQQVGRGVPGSATI